MESSKRVEFPATASEGNIREALIQHLRELVLTEWQQLDRGSSGHPVSQGNAAANLSAVKSRLNRRNSRTLFISRQDSLSPRRRQVGSLQHLCPRQGWQGLCHAKFVQDGFSIGPWPVRRATQAHRCGRQHHRPGVWLPDGSTDPHGEAAWRGARQYGTDRRHDGSYCQEY